MKKLLVILTILLNLPNEEFSIGTASDLKEQLPLSHNYTKIQLKRFLRHPIRVT
jgi:hypothetical protein